MVIADIDINCYERPFVVKGSTIEFNQRLMSCGQADYKETLLKGSFDLESEKEFYLNIHKHLNGQIISAQILPLSQIEDVLDRDGLINHIIPFAKFEKTPSDEGWFCLFCLSQGDINWYLQNKKYHSLVYDQGVYKGFLLSYTTTRNGVDIKDYEPRFEFDEIPSLHKTFNVYEKGKIPATEDQIGFDDETGEDVVDEEGSDEEQLYNLDIKTDFLVTESPLGSFDNNFIKYKKLGFFHEEYIRFLPYFMVENILQIDYSLDLNYGLDLPNFYNEKEFVEEYYVGLNSEKYKNVLGSFDTENSTIIPFEIPEREEKKFEPSSFPLL